MSPLNDFLSRRRGAVGFVAGIAVAGLVAGTGAAIAAIPSSTTATYTGCVAKVSGALRVVDAQAGKKCTSKEKAISWGKGYRYRGSWAVATAYGALDVVVLNGSSYVAKTASKGKSPDATAAAWGLLAAAGAVGATGPAGPTGTAGTPGAPGTAGAPGAKGTARGYGLISGDGSVSHSSGGITVTHTLTTGSYCVSVTGVDPTSSVAVVTPDYLNDTSSTSGSQAFVEYNSGNCASPTAFQVFTFDQTGGTVALRDQPFVFMVP